MSKNSLNILLIGFSHAATFIPALKNNKDVHLLPIIMNSIEFFSHASQINIKDLLRLKILEEMLRHFGDQIEFRYRGTKDLLKDTQALKNAIYKLSSEKKINILMVPAKGENHLFSISYERLEYDVILDDINEYERGKIIIPRRCVYEHLLKNMHYSIIEVCLELFDPQQILLIPPPPPKEYIQSKSINISSADYRYKVWKIYIEVHKEIAKKERLKFFEIPMGFLDKEKFLKKEYIMDSSHANSVYGEVITPFILSELYENNSLALNVNDGFATSIVSG